MFLVTFRSPLRNIHAKIKIAQDPCLWLFDLSLSPQIPCLLGICQLTDEIGSDLCSERTFENNVIFWNSRTHTHNLHFQCGVEFFGPLETNVILGVFNLTKMHSLLMQVRGEIKNTLWNPVVETLIIYFLPWDLFTCSSWFKSTWNISTRVTWLKTNLCQQQNQADRNRTIVFSCHKNVKQHTVSCVFPLRPSWLNYEILFTKKHYSSLFKRINMIKGLVEKWWLKFQLLKCTSVCRENKKGTEILFKPKHQVR